jgi:hypothetical protein
VFPLEAPFHALRNQREWLAYCLAMNLLSGVQLLLRVLILQPAIFQPKHEHGRGVTDCRGVCGAVR